MPMRMARELCPEAIVIKGNSGTYSKYSDMVTEIMQESLPVLEKTSIDEFYADLISSASALVDGEVDAIANMANIAALIWQYVPGLNWAGFYRVVDGELVLGPFQGKTACIRIAIGAGVCGTAAATGEVSMDAWVLFMIIFTWTPPHFWSLALYRTADYAKAGVPMLPVTHGAAYTRLTILVYTCILFGVALLPFATGMGGRFYLACALVLNSIFLAHAIGLYFRYSDGLARRTFRFSILYLAALFAALLVDHYL